jgi:hypothetical protein
MPDDPNPPTTRAPGGSIDQAIASALRLNRALEGTLPCIICGYDLRGVTIRGSCPECGTLVRATILYTVDPQAEEFRPLVTPTITAWAVVAWSVFGFLALLAAWWVRFADAARHITGHALGTSVAHWVVVWGAALSGLAFLGVVRPTRRAPWRATACALLAVAAYVPLVLLLARLGAWDATHASPYFRWSAIATAQAHGTREWIRLGIGACLITIFLAVRPNARELVRRSLAMRTGRVDRQTLLALCAAVIVACIGDGLRLLSPHLPDTAGAIAGNAGSVVVAIGSMFMTLGVASSVIDSWRIRSVILLPAPSLHQILGTQPDTPPAPAPPPSPSPPPAPPAPHDPSPP